MIRRAKKEDLSQVLLLGEQFFEESEYQEALGVTFNPRDSLIWLLELLVREDIGFWVSEKKDGEINGFMIGMTIPLFFNFQEKMAMEILWYVDPESRRGRASKELVAALEEWSRDQGAKFIEVGSVKTIDMERTSKLFERIGYPYFRNGHVKKLEVN